MISLDITVEGDVLLKPSTLLSPKVRIIASQGQTTIIGEHNVLEDLSSIRDSQIGDHNIIEIGSLIEKSQVGNGNIIGTKCVLLNSTIGSNCSIMATIRLEGVTIPDNTSVFLCDGGWRCKNVNTSSSVSVLDAYRQKLASTESPQCLSKNFQPK